MGDGSFAQSLAMGTRMASAAVQYFWTLVNIGHGPHQAPGPPGIASARQQDKAKR
jgi:hypothetical protein